jgi:hypothetical protein
LQPIPIPGQDHGCQLETVAVGTRQLVLANLGSEAQLERLDGKLYAGVRESDPTGLFFILDESQGSAALGVRGV